MIIDSSALIAILRNEPEAQIFAELIERAATVRISAATLFEASMVADKFGVPKLSARFDETVEQAKIIIEPFTATQARIARETYRNYGKGSGHPANLNFGDCFSFALAREKREPLLFKGDDFGHTDLRSALSS
ncbi:MAG: type II toxin-antitoxin system VapC family toxin [Terracidiphilus sp.]|jgi:ribonuclease VapC